MREYRRAERQNEYARVKEYNTEEEKVQREEEMLVREGGKEEQESPTMAQEETSTGSAKMDWGETSRREAGRNLGGVTERGGERCIEEWGGGQR